MKRSDDVFNKLVDLVKENKSHLHILEETIPVDEQFEYFKSSKQVREEYNENIDRNYLVSLLLTPDLDIEEKKKCLSLLAGIPDVAAYRVIETYHSSPLEPELAHWSAMALVESRILINSELTGEQQIFVSTGLGGHNGMLRYFFAISSKENIPFTELQSEIIEREFRFQFDKQNIVIERIEDEKTYVTYLVLAEIELDIKSIVESVVRECNEYGHFIQSKVLITNTKILSKDEIQRNMKPGSSQDLDNLSLQI